MTQNPYQSPTADLGYGGASQDGSLLKALSLGMATDIGSTLVISIPMYIVFARAEGIAAEASERLLLAAAESPPFLVASVLVGLGCTVLGSYVAARIRNRDEMRVGVYFALIAVALGLLFASDMASFPTWYIAASYSSAPVGAMLGAYLRVHTHSRPIDS